MSIGVGDSDFVGAISCGGSGVGGTGGTRDGGVIEEPLIGVVGILSIAIGIDCDGTSGEDHVLVEGTVTCDGSSSAIAIADFGYCLIR